ncbi:hypothetical protein [Acidihalobacter ferrooxydans]|uniref:Uncharacterized protein n=1 Tax=Acidihalobacter ferrooxydans TaxID=1765967 RepID=A0A1P8UKD0_9GAMM|nr:hypothetical protein [Acidihalobacter ferrooxydans]APZ44254.1 hypothetical protein BW247_15115 [Acidihalobacter ferrooxydans]
MSPTASGSQLERFLNRYTGRTLIVHAGFPPDWLEELFKQPGGGGHFRIDSRQLNTGRQTPVDWLIRRHLLPLELPLPLIVKVTPAALFVRHLTRAGTAVHPSDIYWFLEEIDTRHHVRLRVDGGALRAETGLDPADNEALSFLESLGGL